MIISVGFLAGIILLVAVDFVIENKIQSLYFLPHALIVGLIIYGVYSALFGNHHITPSDKDDLVSDRAISAWEETERTEHVPANMGDPEWQAKLDSEARIQDMMDKVPLP